MCAGYTFIISLFVMVKLADFAGDGFLLYWLIHFNEIRNFQDSTIVTWAYLVIAGFSFILLPAVIAVSNPPRFDGDEGVSDEDDFIDYTFRKEEKGIKRVLRYATVILLALFHDVTLAALATDALSLVLSPVGLRCWKCHTSVTTSCNNTSTLSDWNDSHIFPLSIDFYWLIAVGGKLLSVMMSLGYVGFLEAEFRYQRYVMQQQRQLLIFRRHFGGSHSQKPRNRCCELFIAFLILCFFALLAVAAMTTAPMSVLMYTKMSAVLALQSTLTSPILISAIAGVSIWGAFLLFFVAPTLYTFAFCANKKCCRSD
ncbi:uncharacterized protein LOC100178930 [Ciona intestinalis]